MFKTFGTVVVRRRLRLDRQRLGRHRHRAGAAAPARRLRQVRPGAAAGLAAGRDGGPDPGLRADPRGNHGHRRRLPDRPGAPDLRRHRGRPHRGHHRRRGHAAVRLHHRLRVRRHQEGAGVLDGQPDRLHVPRRRPRPGRVRDRHPAPARARLLQGRPVPRRRLGDARHERPGGHAPLRRALAGHADHLRITFGLGYLAIIGFPFLSGFFTKDKIIEAAFDKGGTSGWILGALRAGRRRASPRST